MSEDAITDQSIIRDMPGSYELAVCGEDLVPLSDWVSLAPLTMFDDPIRAEAEITVEGTATGVVSRDGRYKRMFKYPMQVTVGTTVRLTAGNAVNSSPL